MNKSNVIEITKINDFHSLNSSNSVINFWAEWHEPCLHFNKIFTELSINYPKLTFIQMKAEDFSDLAMEYEIETVPTFVGFLNGQIVEKVEGANAPLLTSMVQRLESKIVSAGNKATVTKSLNLNQKLKSLINSYPIMLFMKGVPSDPKCGFSRETVSILNDLNVQYGSFDILADEQVRQGLKEYSTWPTYPQIYVDGELIGGVDILKEMVASGEFQKLIPRQEDLATRLGKLVKKSPIMLFMKGDRVTPKCGFSNKIVKLLNEQGVSFETFDILEDEEVRQGLKEFSDWPTFPQVYINGELIGGLDIVKEMIENGEFQDMVSKM